MAIVLCVLVGGGLSLQLGQSTRLPDQLTDQEFWRMVTSFSEPQGLYTGDNWISNEASIQDVIPPLKQLPGRAAFILESDRSKTSRTCGRCNRR
jgi:hypothetical protein